MVADGAYTLPGETLVTPKPLWSHQLQAAYGSSQALIPALGYLKFEQNRQFNGKIAIQWEDALLKKDQDLPKNEAAYRLQPDAPVAQLDRVRGYEPRGREFESLRARHLFRYSRQFWQCVFSISLLILVIS